MYWLVLLTRRLVQSFGSSSARPPHRTGGAGRRTWAACTTSSRSSVRFSSRRSRGPIRSASSSPTGSRVRALPQSRLLLPTQLCSVNEIAPFVIFLAWVGNVTAGHTKRVTTNAIVMVGYAVGNAVGPQYWQSRYNPRNRVPWAILAACWAASLLILLATRFYLAAENRKRDSEPRDATYDDVYVVDEKGEEKKVDKVCFALACRWVLSAEQTC